MRTRSARLAAGILSSAGAVDFDGAKAAAQLAGDHLAGLASDHAFENFRFRGASAVLRRRA
jgi:hypothetical protein